jgi:hypothetical protein
MSMIISALAVQPDMKADFLMYAKLVKMKMMVMDHETRPAQSFITNKSIFTRIELFPWR